MSAPTPSPGRSGHRPPRAAARAWAAVIGVLGALGVLYLAGYALTGSVVPPNTTVGGVPVGGLAPAAAEAALRADLGPAASRTVTLRAGEATLQRTPAELGLAIDYAASVAGAGGRRTFNPAEMAAALVGGRTLAPVLAVDAAALSRGLAAVAASDHGPTNAGVTFTGVTPVLTPAKGGHVLRVAEAADAVRAAWPAATTIDLPITATPADVTTAEGQRALDAIARPAAAGPVTLRAGSSSAVVPPDAVAASLSFVPTGGGLVPRLDGVTLSRRVADQLARLGTKPAVDATVRLGADGHPHVVPSVDGYGVKPETLAAAVLPVLGRTGDRTAALTLETVKPAFDNASAQKLGIKEVTGEFTTVFPGLYAYRYVNIPKAAGLLTNVLLKPGETFSMNAALGGERTTAKGWAAGFGISNGKENVQVGGALSQVTTTLFNAVFFSGLEDVQHKAHSLYFSRYPQGREATLSYPDVDLKFRNDSPYGVLLQMTWTGHVGVQGTVTARIWSTKQYDVKQANTRISNVRTVPTTPVKDASPDCVAQDPSDGFDIRFDRQWWQGGKLVKSQPYFWSYNTNVATQCTNPVAIAAEQARQSAGG